MIDQFRNEYAFLSNMYPCIINYMGLDFGSTESAYQAMKLPKERWAQFATLDGKTAKKYIKQLQDEIRADWNDVREQIMMELLMIKFSIPELKKMLLDTGDKELIEGNWWNDTFWGVCNGVGQNVLGKMLMRVRQYYSLYE